MSSTFNLVESSAAEPSAHANEPPDEQLQIMKLIAARGDYELDVDGIARLIRQNKTRTQHYLDQLVGRGLLHDALSHVDPTTYGLTKAANSLLQPAATVGLTSGLKSRMS